MSDSRDQVARSTTAVLVDLRMFGAAGRVGSDGAARPGVGSRWLSPRRGESPSSWKEAAGESNLYRYLYEEVV